VGTPYNSSSVVDIEKLITKPLEKEINTITGVDKITSTSVPNLQRHRREVHLQHHAHRGAAQGEGRGGQGARRRGLPARPASEPNIFDMNFSELMPVMNINLSGDYPLEQLHQYAKHLEDRIESLSEINKVEIRGVPERELRVSLDLPQMEQLQLNFNDIAQALQGENITMSGGELLVNGQRRAVRVIGEFKDAEQVKDIVVKNEKLREVRLGDIADVEFAYKEAESYAREYGKPVVMLDVFKRAGENLLTASDEIDQILAEDRGTVLPADLTITKTGDQSDNTRAAWTS
jgi:multidrug efflux pump subunit AcrB